MCDFLRVFMLRRACKNSESIYVNYSFFFVFQNISLIFRGFRWFSACSSYSSYTVVLSYPSLPLCMPFHILSAPNFPPSFPFASGLSASFHKPQLAMSPCPDLRKLVPLQVVFPIFWYSIPSYRTRYWYFAIRQFWMRNNVGKGLPVKFTKQILG